MMYIEVHTDKRLCVTSQLHAACVHTTRAYLSNAHIIGSHRSYVGFRTLGIADWFIVAPGFWRAVAWISWGPAS